MKGFDTKPSWRRTLNSGKTATAVSAVLIALAIVIGSVRPLAEARSEGVRIFTFGTESQGPNAFNLFDDLERFSGFAANVITVADMYSYQSDPLYQDLRDAIGAMDAFVRLRDLPHDAPEAFYLLDAALKLENALLADSKVSDRDKENIRANSQDMASIHTIITREAAQYGYAARVFNDRLGTAPAVVFRMLGVVRPLPVMTF